MDDHVWQVRDGMKTREIRVDYNEANGRAAVRLDGRIAAPPFESDHDEREIDVGDSRYRVLRTARDRFELEMIPAAFSPRPAKRVTSDRFATAKWPGHLLKAVGIGVLLVFALSFAEMGAAYFTPWDRFDSSDGAYSVKLPATPKISSSGGMELAEVKTDDCFYVIGSARLDRKLYKYDDAKMLDDMIRRWKRNGADIVQAENLNDRRMVAGRSVVMNYQGEIDGKPVDSTMKILACSTYDYVVVAVAEFPREGKAPRMKIDRFFRSIQLGY